MKGSTRRRRRVDRLAFFQNNRIIKTLFRYFVRILFVFFLFSLGSVFLLKFIPPVTSAVMVTRSCKGIFAHQTETRYQWTPWEKISPRMALAAVAAEDQKFPDHYGFDFAAIADAIEEGEKGRRLRGASTISQQVAKNLFLWESRSYLRKGLEAYYTVLLETFWSKRRILEIYLNIAQFGDGLYGVKAAAQVFFNKPPSALTMGECALLAGVLPNPVKFKVTAPSPYVLQRARSIEIQMRNLGPSYLKGIWTAS